MSDVSVAGVRERELDLSLLKSAATGDLDDAVVCRSLGAGLSDSRTMSLALANAARHGQLEMVRFCLAEGADPSAENYLALTMASAFGHVEVVRELLPLFDYMDREFKELSLAVLNGDAEVVKQLMQSIADLNDVIKFWVSSREHVVGKAFDMALNLGVRICWMT